MTFGKNGSNFGNGKSGFCCQNCQRDPYPNPPPYTGEGENAQHAQNAEQASNAQPDFVQIVRIGRVQMLKSADDGDIIPTNEPIVQQMRDEWVTFWKNIW
jgi:hypothetical protein